MPTRGGVLLKSEIRKTVRVHRDKFRNCWESLPNPEPTYVKIKFIIETDGKVRSNRVLMNSSGYRTLDDCLTKVAMNMRFPKPKGGIVIVAYPFKFFFSERPEFGVKASASSQRDGWLWNESLLHACYSAFRAKRFGWGSVDFRFSVNTRGKVAALTVKRPPELSDINFTKCIYRAAQDWHFSVARKGKITKTIIFESCKDDSEAIKKIRRSLNKFVNENSTCMASVPKDQNLILTITVTSEGKVTKISKVWSTIKSKEVQVCIEKQIRKWSFPSTGSSVSIKHPFNGIQPVVP